MPKPKQRLDGRKKLISLTSKVELPNCGNCKHYADCSYKDDHEFQEDIRVYCDDWEREGTFKNENSQTS